MKKGGSQRGSGISALVLVLVLCTNSNAFVVTPPALSKASRSSSVELYGVRSALRKRFRKQDSSSDEDGNIESQEFTSSPATVDMVMEEAALQELEPIEARESVVAVLEEEKEDVSVVACLPPRNEAEMSQCDKEFRTMMMEVYQYTENDIRSVEDPRLRALFEGAKAGGVEPAVYRAFEVLFADLIPLRIAGRMIFSKLRQEMENSRLAHQEQVDKVATTTGMSIPDVESGRFAFLSIANYKNDGATVLSLDQLVETGVATTVVEMMGYEDFDDFLAKVDKDKTGEIKFEEFMVGMQDCSDGSCELECNPATVLNEIAKRMKPTDPTDACERKKKYAKRYDEMVKCFVEWEKYIPEGEGRRLDVLRGCFVGGRNKKVVEALKIVYMDYSALRMAGDTVFSLVSKLIRKK